MDQSIGELVRRLENDYKVGNTQISEHVSFSLRETLDRIDAYLNSKHINGDVDEMNRERPFFNISTAASNIWFRATDIDRKNIQIRATNASDWFMSFLATIHVQEWMRRERFGQFLNDWGRTLARYGSAVVKFVKNSSGLHVMVVPWNRIIVDAVDFESNPKVEVIELTEGQLKERVKTHGYDEEQVESLCNALHSRETLSRTRKDNKSEYIRLYEVHGLLSKKFKTGKEEDKDKYIQSMFVVSFVGLRKSRKTEYQDFIIFSAEEDEDPYMITHLIKEDGRSLSIGAVEHLFDAQWILNHSMKSIKDTLDISSKIVFQTADINFLSRNVLDNIQDGDILVHSQNMPLTQVQNAKPDLVGWQNYAVSWKNLGNEINGISEAMLGAAPKSGTAWRQTEALLQESYSLFEVMTENKGLYLEDMFRERILPHIKSKMDTTEEVSAVLDQYQIEKIDGIYIKKKAIRETNNDLKKKILAGERIFPEEQQELIQRKQQEIADSMQSLGNKRFFAPDEGINWKEQFKDLEWDLEVDITGEAKNTQDALATLNTALKLVVTPGFAENKRAQLIVGKILELTGAMSPVEYNAIPSAPTPTGAQLPELTQPNGGTQ